MRPPVAILIASWITGVCAGVLAAVPILLGACIASYITIAYWLRASTQFFIACACVIVLGYMFGSSAVRTVPDRCQGETLSRATLVRTYAVSFSTTQYVFIRNDLCTILVNASRYPLLTRGTIAMVHGSQVHASEGLQDAGIDLVDTNGSLDIEHAGTSIVDRLRMRSIEHISRLFGEPDAAIVTAMLVGDRGALPKRVQDAFRATGISHILAISGLHIAIMIGILALGMRMLPLSPVLQVICTIGLLWVYIWAIGAPPSAMRAGMFWTILTLAYRVGKLTSLPAVMLGALAIAVSLQPMLVVSVGFELSLAAIVGIWIAVRFFRFWMHPVWSLVVVSLGATLGTLPLIVYYFGGTSLIGPIANLVVVPLLPAIVGGAIAAVGISFISMPFGLCISYVVHILLSWVLGVVYILQKVPHSYIDHIHIPGWSVFLYYAVIACALYVYMYRRNILLRSLWA